MAPTKTEEFIQRSVKVHGGKYDYSQTLYESANQKVKIICPLHGQFNQRPSKHYFGSGCPTCGHQKVGLGNRSTIESITSRLLEIHSNKYDYSLFTEHTSLRDNIQIICPVHGGFSQLLKSHLNGCGCAKCGMDRTRKALQLTPVEFIKRASEIHGNQYDYSNIIQSDNIINKVEIICHNHGVFNQSISNHLRGSGCPKCTGRVSKRESAWLDTIDSTTLIRQYPLPEQRRRLVDGYDPTTNTVYQFHGDYWHGNPVKYQSTDINLRTNTTYGELYKNTIIRDQELLDWGYNIVIMWESDWQKL